MFRKLHRWTSLPLILVLFLVIGTGVALQVEEVVSLGDSEAPANDRTMQAEADLDQTSQQLAHALTQLRTTQPDFRPTRIELSVAPGRESTRFAMQPRGGPFVEVDHSTGQVRAEMNPELPLHVMLIRLHTGSAFGAIGVWIMVIASIVLLFLSISGIVLYWQMWRKRVSHGRTKLFW